MSAVKQWSTWAATRLMPVPFLYLWPPLRAFRRRLRHDDPADCARRLLVMLRHAVATVPWYRERYSGVRINSVGDLERFGFLERQTLADDFERFVSQGVRRSDYELGTSGGTSGSPLKLLIPKNRYIVEWASMFELWRRAGYCGQARAVLRNHHLAGADVRICPATREVQFDNFRINDEYLGRVYEIMERYRLRILHAYPSAAYRFASFIEKEKLPLHHLRIVLSGSENVFPFYKQLISDTLGLRFYTWYGHAERLVLAGQCPGSDLYHVEPMYGHFELIDETGRPVCREGEWGEIVGTGLHNFAMPLIRYRTGDYARYAGDYCPVCRRRVPLLAEIRGRWSGERVYRLDGSFVTTTALNVHDDVLARIRGMQYEQERPGQLTVSVVAGPGFSPRTVTELEDFYRDRLGQGSQVTVAVVTELKRRANGKFMLLHKGLDQ